METTTIQVSKTFKDWLVNHGRYGETHEAIIVRLFGDKLYKPTGDRPAKVYSKDDVDSRKTKKKIAFLGKDPGKRREK